MVSVACSPRRLGSETEPTRPTRDSWDGDAGDAGHAESHALVAAVLWIGGWTDQLHTFNHDVTAQQSIVSSMSDRFMYAHGEIDTLRQQYSK